MRRAATAFGAKVASPIVESLDINAILSEVDLDEVLEHVDLNQVFERVDLDRVLDRVDFDRHLARVDLDRLLARVDLDAVVAAANLQEIVRRSTSGVCGGLLHLFRTRLAWTDQHVQRVCRCCCRCRWPGYLLLGRRRPVDYLPPRPGRHPEDSSDEWRYADGLDQREFSKAIQFRTCGALNRIVASVLDGFFLSITFALLYAIVSYLYNVFKPEGGFIYQVQNATNSNDASTTVAESMHMRNPRQLCTHGVFGRNPGALALGVQS